MGTHAGNARDLSATHSSLLERTATWARQLICGMSGHDTMFHFDDRRVSLICVSCGYESPGWQFPGASTTHSHRTHRQPLPKRAA